MILVDLNQVMISNLMMQIGGRTNAPIEEDLVRHMVLNSLRMYRKKFNELYGELVLCCDDRKYWRRDIFPYYKANRKKDRKASGYNWPQIFECLNTIKDDLNNYFPYKVLQVEGAEADDIIATICHNHGHLGIINGTAVSILILSGDKDFGQLQKYANVEQYSPVQKHFIRINNPESFIREHIMKGDRSDGVPNFLSPDNTFVMGLRQTPIASKKLRTWIGLDPEEFCDEKMMRGYKRNQQLVHLDFIPSDLQENIMNAFENCESCGREHLFNYFIKNRMKNLMENIGEF